MTYPEFCEHVICISSDICSIRLTNISDRLLTSRRFDPRLSNLAVSSSRPFVCLSHFSVPFPFTVHSTLVPNRPCLLCCSFRCLLCCSFRCLFPLFPTLDPLSNLAMASRHAHTLVPGPPQVTPRSLMPCVHLFELRPSFLATFSLSASISSAPFSIRSQMIASTCSVVWTW